MSLKLAQRKYSDAAIILFIFIFGVILHAVLHFTVFNFSRAIRIYSDELRYYDIARSFFSGDGLTIRAESTSFQKVGYSLVLMPFFALKDVALRLKAIGLCNIIIMNISVIFVWLLCSELGLKRRTKCFVAFLTAVWPDMMYSMTYMSEVIYWPLTVLFLWLWLVNESKQSCIIAVCEGLLCYFMYLTKEISLAFIIAYTAYEILRPFMKFDDGQNRKKRASLLCIVIAVFASCHVIMKLTLFYGLGNSYNQMGISAIISPYKFMYMIYSFFYYLAAILIASLVIPLVYPAVNFRHMNLNSRKLFCFVILFGLAVSATIAYTISVREDLGRITPSIHLRYYGSFFVVMIMLFFSSMENMTCENITASRRLSAEVLSGAVIYSCFMFRGIISRTSADQYILLWQMAVEKVTGIFYPPAGEWQVIYPSAIITGILITLLSVLFHSIYTRRGKSQAQKFFASVLIVMSIGLNVAAGSVIIYAYRVDPDTVSEIARINEYFREDMTSNIIYLTYGKSEDLYDRYNRYADTYMDRRHHFYIVNAENLTPSTDGNIIKVSGIKLYGSIQSADYILLEKTDSAGHKGLLNAEPMKELCGKHFMLYRNLKPDIIQFKD